MTDLVNNPAHYTDQGPVECIEITEYMTSPNLAAAFQYVWRCDFKGTREQDLRKALWFLRRELTRHGFTLNAPVGMRGVRKFHKWDGSCTSRDRREHALQHIWFADYRRDHEELFVAMQSVEDMLK